MAINIRSSFSASGLGLFILSLWTTGLALQTRSREQSQPGGKSADGTLESEAQKKQKVDLYLFRAQEFERSFYSLRTVEWQVVIQIYTGYAGIAAAYFALRVNPKFQLSSFTLSLASLGLLLLFFLIGWFLQIQLQRRLHFTRGMQNVYIRKLHELVTPELPKPDNVSKPGFEKLWAYPPMMALNLLIVTAIVAAIYFTTEW